MSTYISGAGVGQICGYFPEMQPVPLEVNGAS